MNQDHSNQSGLGNKSVVPPEIKGWNWGAFLLNWIWGIGNSTYIALLMFVPLVNIILMFVLGAKGNEWAWKNRLWRDVEHFKKTQKKWSIAGGIIVFVILPLVFFSISNMLKGDAFNLSLETIKSNTEVTELLGSPIEHGFFVTGSIQIGGGSGKAILYYTVIGPKGEAEAYVIAEKEMGKWVLRELIVYEEEHKRKIIIITSQQKMHNKSFQR
ncbi:MAG: hypothetical protein JKY90_06310 [Gammaproteobacteria bacterium]|nr:hypothetical protein [Gammaproteobacteria bacterium]